MALDGAVPAPVLVGAPGDPSERGEGVPVEPHVVCDPQELRELIWHGSGFRQPHYDVPASTELPRGRFEGRHASSAIPLCCG